MSKREGMGISGSVKGSCGRSKNLGENYNGRCRTRKNLEHLEADSGEGGTTHSLKWRGENRGNVSGRPSLQRTNEDAGRIWHGAQTLWVSLGTGVWIGSWSRKPKCPWQEKRPPGGEKLGAAVTLSVKTLDLCGIRGGDIRRRGSQKKC